MNIYDEFVIWYKENEDSFRSYSKYIHECIEHILPEYKVYPAYLSSRQKTIDSIGKKCRKLKKDDITGELVYKYTDPKTQITDMAGVRVVTYTGADIDLVSHIIRKNFCIDTENSVDKGKAMSLNEVGYLSIHYVVSLKESDEKYPLYKGVKCEIQVRTVLQDAWAQIFHDRQYKPYGEQTPSDELLRQTNLLAASLELLDDNIGSIVKKYDDFYKTPNNKIYQKFLDEKVSESSLMKYVRITMGADYCYYDYKEVQRVLEYFNIDTLRDVDSAFVPVLAEQLKSCSQLTIDRIVVSMVIVKYPEQFFEKFKDDFVLSGEVARILKDYINDIDKYIN